MIKRLFLFFTILIAVHAKAENTAQICERFKNIPFPQSDNRSAAMLKSLEDCPRSVDLYYGISKTSNFEQARLCAYREDGSGEVFTGRAILMMIYANGRGVKQNLALAICLACAIDGPSGQTKGRVQHLLNFEKNKGKAFDFCDDVTSRDMIAQCGTLKLEIEKGQGEQKVQALFGKQDADYLSLKKTTDTFFALRGDAEFYYRDSSSQYEVASLYKDFYSDVEKCAGGKGPASSLADLKKSDDKLNRIYKKMQSRKIPEDLSNGGVSKGGIRSVQKAWLRYRDAWVKFGQKKCPGIQAEGWKTLLTESRAKMLSELE